ncbi:hypothetical protein GCM10027445_18600 [Amycolatopsis endophytica]
MADCATPADAAFYPAPAALRVLPAGGSTVAVISVNGFPAAFRAPTSAPASSDRSTRSRPRVLRSGE